MDEPYWKSLEQLDHEIARLELCLLPHVDNPELSPKINQARRHIRELNNQRSIERRIESLKSIRWWFIWPRIYKLRVVISRMFQTLADWSHP